MTRAVYNPFSPEHKALQSQETRRVLGVGHLRRMGGHPEPPVGMRGSIPERLATSERFQKKKAGEARWESLRQRMQDEDVGSDYDYMDEEPEPHPTTGLPSYGALPTHKDFEGEPAIGFGRGSVPPPLSFHQSTAGARRAAGRAEWIPVPGLQTPQQTVSATRVHQAMENPETTASPRFPPSHRELPHVYEGMGQKPGERTYTMIDGNHRASANILQGRLFMEANVLRDQDIPKVTAHTARISKAKTAASRKTDPDFVEGRMQRNVNGDMW